MRAGRLMGLLVVAVTSAAFLIGPGTGSAAVGSSADGGSAGSSGPGSVLWSRVHAAEGHAVAVDPQGGTVFVVGSTGLVAYNAATGATLWDNAAGPGRSVAVTPDGHIVFVIRPTHTNGTWDFSTKAFDAGTGKRLWARLYNGRANGDDRPAALAVSPGGGTVFVTGTSQGKTSGRDYATVAYAAATGRQLWVSRYNGHGHGADVPVAIAVSPGGGAVFVTGTSSGRSSGSDFATVGYAAATGATLWVRRYHGPTERHDVPGAVLVSSRDGGTVIVAGAG